MLLYLSVGQFVGFLEGGGGGGGGHFLFEVQSDIAKFLLDVTNDFSLSGGGERVTALGQDLHQVVGQVATSQVQTEDGVGKGVTFIDGDGVGDTITRVQDDTSGTTGSVQGQDSLDGDVHGGAVEGLEHDLYIRSKEISVSIQLSSAGWLIAIPGSSFHG